MNNQNHEQLDKEQGDVNSLRARIKQIEEMNLDHEALQVNNKAMLKAMNVIVIIYAVREHWNFSYE